MIHVLHGFLGRPEDFSFLAFHPEVKLHDLYEIDFKNLVIHPEDVIIGYSMGGRLAMELADKFNFNLKKLVLINAHPGLQSEDERAQRSIWENEVLEKLSSEDFIQYWNQLPVFSKDAPLLPISTQKREDSKRIFDLMRLSKQENYLPKLNKHSQKILYLAGLDDLKYSTLAREVLSPSGIKCREMKGGHRLHQHPASLLQVLTEEGIL